MQKIKLFEGNGDNKTILCLGAHCDDIEIGCGGTIIRLQEDYPSIKFHWVIFSSNSERASEAQKKCKFVSIK